MAPWEPPEIFGISIMYGGAQETISNLTILALLIQAVKSTHLRTTPAHEPGEEIIESLWEMLSWYRHLHELPGKSRKNFNGGMGITDHVALLLLIQGESLRSDYAKTTKNINIREK